MDFPQRSEVVAEIVAVFVGLVQHLPESLAFGQGGVAVSNPVTEQLVGGLHHLQSALRVVLVGDGALVGAVAQLVGFAVAADASQDRRAWPGDDRVGHTAALTRDLDRAGLLPGVTHPVRVLDRHGRGSPYFPSLMVVFGCLAAVASLT